MNGLNPNFLDLAVILWSPGEADVHCPGMDLNLLFPFFSAGGVVGVCRLCGFCPEKPEWLIPVNGPKNPV